MVLADDLADVTAVHIAAAGVTVDGSLLRAEAGANWDEVVALSLRPVSVRLECLSGIPGTAGATPAAERGLRTESKVSFVTATSPGIEPRDRPGALVMA
ncbi:UDP-N-acetylenolpyruvoylglucosamine reductase domain protein [Mycobacteroides abscessus]|nr:UDP-N-acetylenolpyruvoylglucosamine reductase domain protein [Mycobacteroides abscessus]